jgi:hypothetical protein
MEWFKEIMVWALRDHESSSVSAAMPSVPFRRASK